MAASTKQIEANRRNAAGPHQMSEAGKQSIRTNAIRHGLTCKIHVVLPGEDQEFFNELLASLQNDYAPAGTQEEMLVHQIAEHYWRLIRARNIETVTFDFGLAKLAQEGTKRIEPDDETRAVNLLTGLNRYENLFDKARRYETSVERSYYRAINQLQKIQAQARKTGLQPPPAAQPAPEPTPDEIRSVLQNQAPAPEVPYPSAIFPSRTTPDAERTSASARDPQVAP